MIIAISTQIMLTYVEFGAIDVTIKTGHVDLGWDRHTFNYFATNDHCDFNTDHVNLC